MISYSGLRRSRREPWLLVDAAGPGDPLTLSGHVPPLPAPVRRRPVTPRARLTLSLALAGAIASPASDGFI
jgi:hypothetical protein